MRVRFQPNVTALEELQLGADLDPALEAAGDGADARVEAVDALGLLALLRRHREPVADGDPLDHEHAVTLEHLTDGLRLVALVMDLYLTRLQRARERAGQSAPRRCDDVVERGRVRGEVPRVDAVVLGDLGVNAERDRLALRGQMGEPLRTAEALDAHPRDVCGTCHA